MPTLPPRESIWINRGDSLLSAEQIALIERKHDAKYLGDFTLRMPSGQWTEEAYACFWNETPAKPEYSNYFSISKREGYFFIGNAISISEGEWYGAMADDGEIIYSRYRHDYRRSRDGSTTVDGGRDYSRGMGGIGVTIRIVRDAFWVNDVLSYPVRSEGETSA